MRRRDFVADNPGDALVHCHQKLHMDFGFTQLIRYTGYTVGCLPQAAESGVA